MTRHNSVGSTFRKLNLGCGTDIRSSENGEEWTHLDSAPLPGVDVVHNLTQFPWPLRDNAFDEIIAYDILEHLPDTIHTMEELWRILRPGGSVEIRVPYWNSIHQINDPTHVKSFNEFTLDFFNVNSELCKTRPYYSSARFEREWLKTTVGFRRKRYILPEGKLQRVTLGISRRIGNVTQMMTLRMRAVKE